MGRRRVRVGRVAVAAVLVAAAGACKGGGGEGADPTTTVAAPTIDPSVEQVTTTTLPDYTTPPPWLVAENWQGDALKALSVFAWAEHAAVQANVEPYDPNLPALVATHSPGFLAQRQSAIRATREQRGQAITFGNEFSIRVKEFAELPSGESLITACLTTDYMVHPIGTQPEPVTPDSSLMKASVVKVAESWQLKARQIERDFIGKKSCDG